MSRLKRLSGMLLSFSIVESVCFFACPWPVSTSSQSRRKSTASANNDNLSFSPPYGGIPWHCIPGCRRRRFRREGRPARQRKRSVGTAREHNGHGNRSRRYHPRIRPNLRRAFESRCHAGRCNRERSVLGKRISVCGHSGFRRDHGGRSFTFDVWSSSDFTFTAYTKWPGAIPQRVHRNVWPCFSNLGMLPRALRVRSIRSGGLYNRRVLVHGVNVLRQSRRNDCEVLERHFRRDSPRRRPAFYSRANSRSTRRHVPVPLASPKPVILCQRRARQVSR